MSKALFVVIFHNCVYEHLYEMKERYLCSITKSCDYQISSIYFIRYALCINGR